ncbi:MAG: hypothetical protein JSW64_12990 [Candidatus Zixiibacteriota bacterium]|nr:MAG: hypothetical protein JSW64_12990 [candidate division Zixibacteria bacterium]
MDSTIRVRMILDETQRAVEEETNWGDPNAVVESVNNIVPDQGGALGPARFTGVVEVILAAGVMLIAKRIVDHVLAGRGGGVLIDTRTDPATIDYVKTVRRNTAMIVKADGSVEKLVFDQDKDSLVGIISAALGGDG